MKKVFVILLLCAAALSACQKKPVAVVNGEEVSEKFINRIMRERIKDHEARAAKADLSALRKAVIEQAVVEKLMLQAAKVRGISVSDSEVEADIEALKKIQGEKLFLLDIKADNLTIDEFKGIIRERLIVMKFMDSFVTEEDVTENEMKDYYKNSSTPFLKPESVYVRFIETPVEEQANAIVSELRDGKADFDKLAERLAVEKRATISDYGWTSPTYFSPAIAAAMSRIKPGDWDGPFRGGKEGFYILKVKDRQKQGVKSYEEARAEIKTHLLSRKRDAAIAHWAAARRNSAVVVIN